MNRFTGQLSTHTAVVAIGKESVGKSQLIASLTVSFSLLLAWGIALFEHSINRF
ncbi:hypothetical protein [Coleofasciculus sp.]|uniref:hypothetical protein n=1 Tax=Coleofasciculus sp. TaxID=3100458 RepID=UPI003A49BCCC